MPVNEGLEQWVPLVIGGVVLGLIVVSIFAAGGGRRRRAALAAWARSIGLAYAPARDAGMAARLPGFAVFHQGRNQYAYNVVSGVFEGRELVAFDYHYETQHTVTVREKDANGRMRTRTETRTTHHHFSAVLVRPELPLKPLLIRPEGLFDKVADFFGRGDLDFESAEFSRRYHVTAPDRRWAYDVLHARTIDFLLDQPRLVIEMDPHHVLVMRPGQQTMSAETFDAAVRTADQMLDLLPEYVRRDAAEPATANLGRP